MQRLGNNRVIIDGRVRIHEVGMLYENIFSHLFSSAGVKLGVNLSPPYDS
jgi:hypothetical protein